MNKNELIKMSEFKTHFREQELNCIRQFYRQTITIGRIDLLIIRSSKRRQGSTNIWRALSVSKCSPTIHREHSNSPLGRKRLNYLYKYISCTIRTFARRGNHLIRRNSLHGLLEVHSCCRCWCFLTTPIKQKDSPKWNLMLVPGRSREKVLLVKF